MKTPRLSSTSTTAVFAALVVFSSSSNSSVAEGASGVLPSVPTISIRATVPETREPFCDPAICDAAPPPPGVFVVSRRGGDLTRELSVLLTYEGTASNGVDYAQLPGFVLFPAGAASVELFVEGAYDRLPEGDETVVARLQPDPSLGPIERYRLDPLQSVARVLLHDNETPLVPTVSIEATSPIAEESSYPYRRLAFRGRFTISRTGSTDQAMPVFVLYSGSATPGVDYPFLPWLVSIPAGTNRVEIEVVPKADDVAEPIEIVEATLSECPPLTDPPMGIPCYLVNIDPAHASARVFIRDDGITTSSLDLTAPKDGAEFSAGESIRIAATAIDLDGAITHVEFYDADTKVGESTISFIRAPDPGTPIYHEFEWKGAAVGTHVLAARAVNTAGLKVTSPSVQIKISDGLPIVSIEATVPETTEPSLTSRIRPGVFTLRRTGGATGLLRVWVSYGGSATPGSDYTALPGVVEFPAGAASVAIDVAPLDDDLVEGDETVIGELTPSPLGIPPNYRIDPVNYRARVIIHDNDVPGVPVVNIVATRAETMEPVCPPGTCLAPTPAPGVFTITRSGGDSTHGLSVLLRYGGSAMPRSDYDPLPEWVEIPAGQATVELYVTASFDQLVEGDETVFAALQPDPSLGPVERYRIDPAQAAARVVIHDRTPPTLPVVTIIATDPFAREGTNSNTATFVVSRAGPTNTAVSVRFLVGGTASNGVDYAAITGPLLLAAGQRSARIVINPIDDNRPEPIETVIVTLVEDNSAVPGYTLGTPRRAAAIIVDNDRPRPPCLRLPDGLFNVCLPAGSDNCFRVEVTRDFKEWTPLCIVPANENWAHFVDPDAPGLLRRFYRYVPVPCEP